jgi:hypothetical protein
MYHFHIKKVKKFSELSHLCPSGNENVIPQKGPRKAVCPEAMTAVDGPGCLDNVYTLWQGKLPGLKAY